MNCIDNISLDCLNRGGSVGFICAIVYVCFAYVDNEQELKQLAILQQAPDLGAGNIIIM